MAKQDSTALDAPPATTIGQSHGNGFAVAAMVLGIVGAVFGFVPILYVIALPCGALALIFGLLAWRASRKPGGSRKGMAIAGTALGCIALALGVWGAVIVDDAVSDFERDMDRIEQEYGASDPCASALPADSTPVHWGCR